MCVSYPTLYCTCGGDGGGEGDDAALADRRAVLVVVEGVIAGQLNASFTFGTISSSKMPYLSKDCEESSILRTSA